MNKGFIKLFVIFILLVVIVSLLGIKIGEIPEKNTIKENFAYLFSWARYVWDNYIQQYSGAAWEKAREYIWEPILKAAGKIKN